MTSSERLRSSEVPGVTAAGRERSARELPLREILAEDYHRHYLDWKQPGLHALWVYRLGERALTLRGRRRRRLAWIGYQALQVAVHNLYGTEISPEAMIGRRVLLGHHQGVLIPAFVVIGDDCLIRHNVNIGFASSDAAREAVPHIGRGVEIGNGASILGPIVVGDGAKIGPHALVMTDVPAGATAFSPPARVLKPAASRPDRSDE